MWRSTQLLALLQQSLSTALSIPEHDIKPGTQVRDDLRTDSLDVIEFVMELESELGIAIADGDYERIRTVGDAVRYIERRERKG